MVENKHYIITFETIIEAGDLFDAVKKGNRLALKRGAKISRENNSIKYCIYKES